MQHCVSAWGQDVPGRAPRGSRVTAPLRPLALGCPAWGATGGLAATPPSTRRVTAAPLPRHALFMLEPLA